MIINAARGGDVNLVRRLLQVSQIPLSTLWDLQYALSSAAAAEGGHLEAVKQFYQMELEAGFAQWCTENGLPPPLTYVMTGAMMPSPQPEIISWYLMQDLSLLGTWKDMMEHYAVTNGLAEWMGDLQSYFQQMKSRYHQEDRVIFGRRIAYAHVRVLERLLEELGIEKFENLTIEMGACGRDVGKLQWMKEHGIQFRFDRVLIADSPPFDTELIRWILDQDVRPTAQDIACAARHFRIDILEMLWAKKSTHLIPDSQTIPNLIEEMLIAGVLYDKDTSRFTYTPILKTLEWLKDKGYTCGPKLRQVKPYQAILQIMQSARDRGGGVPEDLAGRLGQPQPSVYDDFVLTLRKKKPRFFADYSAEIQALELPLSTSVFDEVFGSKAGELD